MKVLNEKTCPYAAISFYRSNKDKTMYCVSRKEGAVSPSFLGQLPYEPYIGAKEYIVLGYECGDIDDGLEWAIYTTNPDTIATTDAAEQFQEMPKYRIAKFQLTPERRACATYGDDAMLIELSEDWRRLTILFYEGLGRYVSSLLTVWNHGLLEDTIVSKDE
jgi:hypothetical protein